MIISDHVGNCWGAYGSLGRLPRPASPSADIKYKQTPRPESLLEAIAVWRAFPCIISLDNAAIMMYIMGMDSRNPLR